MMHLRGWGTAADVPKAATYFAAAAKAGNLLGSYNLAMLHLGGHTTTTTAGAEGGCAAAVPLLKGVAERGFGALQEGADDWAAGDAEWALLNYFKAAEMGVELGESNAAWLLSEGYGYQGGYGGWGWDVLWWGCGGV